MRRATLPRMSTATLQVWEQIQKLSSEEQEELRDRLIRESLPDYGEITEEELIAASRQMAAVLDAEENADAR